MDELIDSHAHLEEIENLEVAIQEAKEAGVVAIIAVGSSYQSNQRVLELSAKYQPLVYPALGLHPWELGRIGPSEIGRHLAFIEDNLHRVVGIGEVGLDYDKRVTKVAAKDWQRGVCREVFKLASRYHKPALIHSRYAWSDAFVLAQEAGLRKAVFHWYTGLSSVLREIIAQGYFISATPAAEYHAEHRRAIKEAPLANLLLETDCPVQYGRESRYTSRPADIVRSLRAASQLKGMESRTVAQQTTVNARRLFGLG